MEMLSSHCYTLTRSSIISSTGIVLEQPFMGVQRLSITQKQQPLLIKPWFILQDLRAQASACGISGSAKVKNQTTSDSYISESKDLQKSVTCSGVEKQSKDNQLVFVAGATGRVGSRVVRELLKLGFSVRAGTRNLQKAEALLERVAQLKLGSQSSNLSAPSSPTVEKNLEIVECDLEKPDDIVPAISNAGVVVCCIGASEKEVFDVTGPYRIDYQATKNLIVAATIANVNHFILLTSLGTSKFGFPASVLNLFWGVLVWKRKAEEALINSGLPYSIVRPGGMERPTDAYKETHNLVLASADTYFGGQVSNLQVAELIACMVKNVELSMNKVVEVIAETTAPLLPMEELLAKIPSAGGVAKSRSQQQRTGTEPVESPPEPKSSVELVTLESASGVVAGKDELQLPAQKSRSLSPYPMYEDLKPPTSPTPSAPNLSYKVESPSEHRFSLEPVMLGSGVFSKKEEPQLPLQKAKPLSPYPMYEDFKPPSSPSPTSPSKQIFAAEAVELPFVPRLSMESVVLESAPCIIAEKKESQLHPQKSRPLSPYPMYEDLKPPTSPSPTLRLF